MAIQAVSFGQKAVTKNGNEYQRTSKATKIGAGVGATWGILNSSAMVYMAAKNKMPQQFKNIYLNTYKALRENNFTREIAKNTVKKSAKAAIAIGVPTGIAVATLIGLGIGAAVNKIINHKKAAKADAVANAKV